MPIKDFIRKTLKKGYSSQGDRNTFDYLLIIIYILSWKDYKLPELFSFSNEASSLKPHLIK